MHVRVEVTEWAQPMTTVVRGRPEQIVRRVRGAVASHLGVRRDRVALEGEVVVLLRDRREGGRVVTERVPVGRARALN